MTAVVSEYEKGVRQNASKLQLTNKIMKDHTIIKLLDGRFKCNCCNSIYNYESHIKEHIGREVHKNNIEHYNIMKQMERSLNAERNKNRSLMEKVQELEDKLFKFESFRMRK